MIARIIYPVIPLAWMNGVLQLDVECRSTPLHCLCHHGRVAVDSSVVTAQLSVGPGGSSLFAWYVAPRARRAVNLALDKQGRANDKLT